jgi:hypothetical protein
MIKREDFVKALHEDLVFKATVDAAKTETEKRFVMAFSEEFLMSFIDVLSPISEEIDRDPEEFRRRLLEIDEDLLSEGETIPSAK